MSQINDYLSQIADYSGDMKVAAHKDKDAATKFQEIATSVLPISHNFKQGQASFGKLKGAIDKARDTVNKAKDTIGKVKESVTKAKETINKLKSGEDVTDDLFEEPTVSEAVNPSIAETSFGAIDPGTDTFLRRVPTQEEAVQASRAAQARQARPTNDDLPEGSGEIDDIAQRENIEMAPQEVDVPQLASQLDEGNIVDSLSDVVANSTSGAISALSDATPLATEGAVDGIISAIPGIGEIAAPFLLLTGLIGSIVTAIEQPDPTPAPSLQLDV